MALTLKWANKVLDFKTWVGEDFSELNGLIKGTHKQGNKNIKIRLRWKKKRKRYCS
jgi:hypothetical protein